MYRPSSPQAAERLRTALAALVDGLPPRRAAAAVERLIGHYREGGPTHVPVLRDRADVVAYAAYRMPATFEADVAALRALATRLPGWSPASQLDVGGGTGAAVWAAHAVWGDGPGGTGPDSGSDAVTRTTTVLDWAEPALALGRELASDSDLPAVRAARWQPRAVAGRAAVPDELPAAGLVTASYVLGELAPEDRRALVDAAVAAADEAVVLVEPGTPEGYLRVVQARDQLLTAGLTVLAPCPHSGRCPIVPGEDWCHFATRVSRSSLQRRVKGGSLPYEDEKYSYVAAVTSRLADVASPAPSRIVRRPRQRKGQVLLDLCTRDEAGTEVLRSTTVSKRRGSEYRAARDAAWGDAWPPESGPRP